MNTGTSIGEYTNAKSSGCDNVISFAAYVVRNGRHKAPEFRHPDYQINNDVIYLSDHH